MRRTMAFLYCVIAGTASSLGHAESPFNGTWQLDPDVLEVKLLHGVFDCFFCTPVVSVKADGRDHDVRGVILGMPLTTVQATEIGPRNVSIVGKEFGSPILTLQLEISGDGNTLLLQQTAQLPGRKKTATHRNATLTRLSEGPPTAHAVSGRWSFPVEVDYSSFQIEDNTLVRKDSQGSSFNAKLDGSEAAYDGLPGQSVSLKLIDDHTLEQTDKKNGKVWMVEQFTVDPDGKTLHMRYADPNGRVTTQTAHRVEGTAGTGAAATTGELRHP